MLELNLNNFRCHVKKSISISEGSTLIKGDSGAGKSTILEAIRFVLYDLAKPTTIGKKTCSVTLEDDNFKITRARPKNLVLTMKKTEVDYNGPAAQEIINNHYGNQSLFPYIPQLGVHSFLSCTSTERNNMLFDLAYGDRKKLDDLKNKVKTTLKERKDTRNKADKEYEKVKYHFDKIDKDIDVENDDSDTLKGEIYKLERSIKAKEKECKAINESRIEKKLLVKRLKALREVTDIDEKELSTIEDELKECKKELNTAVIKKERDESRITELKEQLPEKTPNDPKKLLTKLQTKCKFMKKAESYNIGYVELTEIKTRFESFFDEDEKLKRLKEKREEDIKYNDRIETEGKNNYSCPHCDKNIKMKDSTLVKNDDFEKGEAREIGEDVRPKIRALETKIKQYREIISNMESGEYARTKESEPMEKKVKDLEKIVRVMAELKRLESVEKIDGVDEAYYHSLEKKKTKLEAKIRDMDKKRIEFKNYNRERDSISNNIDEITIGDDEDLIKEITTFKEKITTLNDEIDLIKEKSKIDKVRKDLKEKTTIKKEKEDSYDKIADFAKIVKECEIKSLMTVIEQLNTLVNDTLSRIFKDPIKIEISTEKTTSTSTKTEINVKIHYKDMSYDNLTQLSGGERVRLSIALAIAFNTILGNNLILLDESFNSVEEEIKNDIIDIVNDLNLTTLVISHEAISGHFDNTISM